MVAGLLAAGVGVFFVKIKNEQVALGLRKGDLREEIAMLERQIEEANGWIVRMEDRKNLEARLRRADSDLVRFGASQVIAVKPVRRAELASVGAGGDGGVARSRSRGGEVVLAMASAGDAHDGYIPSLRAVARGLRAGMPAPRGALAGVADGGWKPPLRAVASR